MSYEEYRVFGLIFDRETIEPAQDLWCNMLHLHGQQVHFKLVNELPFQMVNWHDRETPPTLEEAHKHFKGVACGGHAGREHLFTGMLRVRKEAEDAIRQTGGKSFLLGTGCVVPVIASHGNLLAARNSVE